ncbi:MAG: autotransporter outer membrane beta-barrel domain-containing protein [Betaproteobacteria bacterium]
MDGKEGAPYARDAANRGTSSRPTPATLVGEFRRISHVITWRCILLGENALTKFTLRWARRMGALAAMWLSCIVAFSGTASGQGNLAKLPGLTELQQPTATAVNVACVQFGPSGYVANPQGTPAERLFYTCRVMVQTANQLSGSGLTANSLNISNPELRTGVQAVSDVQGNAQKQIGIEAAKISPIGSRLFDLRSGARGLVVGVNGDQTQPSQRSLAQGAAGDKATGGGASADAAMDDRWGSFVNVGYNWGKVDETTLQDPYKFGSFNVLAGLDYRLTDSLVVGGAFSYSDTHSDYEQSLGNVKAATIGAAGYATWYSANWYVDGFLAYGNVDYDSTRIIFIPSNSSTPAINTTATSKPKGDQWSMSIGVGANYETGGMTVTPTARLGYIWVKNKAFSEEEPINGLGLAVDARTLESFQSALGVKLATVVSAASGVFVPYVSAQWMHEFKNDSPSIISKYVNDPFNTFFAIPTANPTRDYAVLVAGSSVTFPNNFSGFVQFSAALGLSDQTVYGAVLGVRKQF